jgi:hypothetical protein
MRKCYQRAQTNALDMAAPDAHDPQDGLIAGLSMEE